MIETKYLDKDGLLNMQLDNPMIRANSITDTSKLGGVYNTPSGNQGLMSQMNNWWDTTDLSFGNTNQWKAAGDVASGLGSIGNVYLGAQGLGLMEDQLAIQEDQWAETKAELARLRGVRKKVTQTYMG